MTSPAESALAATIRAAFDIQVRSGPELEPAEMQRAWSALDGTTGSAVAYDDAAARFAVTQWGSDRRDILVAGPYGQAATPDASLRPLTPEEETRLLDTLDVAAAGLRRVSLEPRRLLDSSRQMEILSSAVIAISGELQLSAVLRAITDLARTFASAKYAALGVPNASGQLETFITDGVPPDVEAQIGHRPRGLGLLGKLLQQRVPMRLDDIASHPDSVGFPENHPPMHSFLGVPIVSRGGDVIGSLYLAEKQTAPAFSVDDEQLIELLARHAAVAIENARLYRRLESDERRLGQILDELPEAVMLLESTPDRVVVINQQARQLLGVTAPVPIPVEELCQDARFFDEDQMRVNVEQTPFVRSLVTGRSADQEEITVVVGGEDRRTLLVNSAPIALEDSLDAHICVFQDITEIRDADRLKDDFLSLVSHELRTPLTTIHGGAQMLMKDRDRLDAGVIDELLADIHRESARLAALIQNMVQLTHIRAGRVALEPEPVLVRVLVERCVGQLATLEPEREIRVNVGPGVVAMADEDRVDEILRNLIQNAFKYTPAGTPIDVSGYSDGDAVVLSVRDYGAGIPSSEMAKVFDRFERGSQASSSTSGMGLGLYIVRLLVEAQGGSVGIERPDGGGTSVSFTLPRALDE